MDRDALIHRLAETIAGDKALLLDDWTHLVLVSHTGADTPDMTGFCYMEDGRAFPVAPQDFAMFDVLEQLRAAMAKADGKKPWTAALFRIEPCDRQVRHGIRIRSVGAPGPDTRQREGARPGVRTGVTVGSNAKC
jgi:hypothetical protein